MTLVHYSVVPQLLVIIDVQPTDLELPVSAYVAVEEVHSDGTPTTKTFEHLTSEVGAEEAEEVGVEHLLRDIKDLGAVLCLCGHCCCRSVQWLSVAHEKGLLMVDHMLSVPMLSKGS